MAVPQGFIRVSVAHPCPMCGRSDWCLVSDDDPDDPSRVICPRTASPARWGESGYLHVRQRRRVRPPQPSHRAVAERPTERPEVLHALAGLYRRTLKPEQLRQLADELNVSPESLQRLGIGWCGSAPGYSWPMRNVACEVVGLSIRRLDGSKTSASGGSLGLFVPTDLGADGPLLLPEGASDTAALLDLGFDAIGRPSCNGGVRHAIALVRRRKPSSIVVVADADEPGRHGAQRLARALVLYAADVRIIEPPPGSAPGNAPGTSGETSGDETSGGGGGGKDVRAWKSAGATHEDVMSLIRDAEPFRIVVQPTI